MRSPGVLSDSSGHACESRPTAEVRIEASRNSSNCLAGVTLPDGALIETRFIGAVKAKGHYW
jgi:hypothetical protein